MNLFDPYLLFYYYEINGRFPLSFILISFIVDACSTAIIPPAQYVCFEESYLWLLF